jgi:excisionase family DNA binding protein
LTYDEAAKILKTTTRHVERLVSRRQLKAVALGQVDKLLRIRPADLLALIDSMEPITRADEPPAAAQPRKQTGRRGPHCRHRQRSTANESL